MLSLYIQIELFDCSIEQKKQIELLWHYSQSDNQCRILLCISVAISPQTLSLFQPTSTRQLRVINLNLGKTVKLHQAENAWKPRRRVGPPNVEQVINVSDFS